MWGTGIKRLFLIPILLLTGYAASAAGINQSAFNASSQSYEYGYRSIPNVPIAGAPADTDWKRSAMLHDGLDYRLYFFKKGSESILYQFAFNPDRGTYEHGYKSIPVLKIAGAPNDIDSRRLMMLHDGSDYRLYMGRQGRPSAFYQFSFNPRTSDYEFGRNSIPVVNINGMPGDTDWNRTAMLHDGSDYRFYAMRAGSNDTVYQAAFNRSSSRYEYGYQSIKTLRIIGMPALRGLADPAMLHDRRNYRLYFHDGY